MTIAEMKQRKIELGYSNKSLSEKTGVPIGTLQKIFSGETTAPREDTIKALEWVLNKKESYDTSPAIGILREAAPVYGSKREYTIDDYMALPDDQRVELIDGEFFEMYTPTTVHQGIAGYVHGEFLKYVSSHKGKCFPMISPVDVQLDKDNKTMVQPDVIIICDRSKITRARVFGAPDFILEVLSPSTKKKDMQLKLYKYGNAGVREYWMLDPDKKILVQYDLENMEMPVIYSFKDKVPVKIWNNECVIDLNDMYESIGFLWELALN